MQAIDRHNKKLEELAKRVKALEEMLQINAAVPINRGPGRPKKDAA